MKLSTPNNIYFFIKDDDAAIAQMRRWGMKLAMDCANPDEKLEVTSFTLNGQSGGGELGGTKEDLLDLIKQVLLRVDKGAPISTRRRRVQF
jgi:hypothetical protein